MKAHEGLTQETLYDYDSIMHYSSTTFTKNGKNTMQAKFDPSKSLGGTKMSSLDILELNKIYQCNGTILFPHFCNEKYPFPPSCNRTTSSNSNFALAVYQMHAPELLSCLLVQLTNKRKTLSE